MSFTARLFVLLAIAIPTILAGNNDLPVKFPTENVQDTNTDGKQSDNLISN